MGMPFLLQQNQTGSTAPVFVDWMQTPFSLSFAAIATGAPTYNIEYALDNVDVGYSSSTTGFITGPFSGNANVTSVFTWFQSSVSGTTSSASGNIASPVRAVRVNLVTSSATAFVVVNFMQATFGR